MTTSSIRAPRIQWLRVVGLHLYNEGDPLELDLSKPISAFVGANGIGKSTLLSLINFAMTGLVPAPNALFQSVEEFGARTQGFASDYFAGRVNESDRTIASVTVRFRLGAQTFEVERGLFEGRLVRSFKHSSATDMLAEVDEDDNSLSDKALAYQRAIVEASGLASFDQFCFWQLFMMTFDERRHLLFWDEKTLQSALMIALGKRPQDAVEAEALTRKIERQDSLARNARWRATQATNKRRRILAKAKSTQPMTDDELLALREQNDSLIGQELAARKRRDESEVELEDASREIAEHAIAESELEAQYLTAFSKTGPRTPSSHALVRAILDGGHCEICGSHSERTQENVRNTLARDECPLCGEKTDDHEHLGASGSELIELDQRLAGARSAVSEARSKYQRIRENAAADARAWREASERLALFRKANSEAFVEPKDEESALAVKRYDQEISEAMRDAEEHRSVRDSFRNDLEPIISGLVDAYSQIETFFVPTFRRLAEQFIGRSVDVEFERRGVAVGLRFALEGQSRRSASELSESQQFFLDIALRMSIIETFSTDSATLIVDTPEGSLDIAYETRAGMLFAQFVESDHSLIVMSNLNSSNLLGRLTELSSPSQMDIFKMIEWSRLSDVQILSAPLFDRVYAELEASLHGEVPA